MGMTLNQYEENIEHITEMLLNVGLEGHAHPHGYSCGEFKSLVEEALRRVGAVLTLWNQYIPKKTEQPNAEGDATSDAAKLN